MSNNMSYLISSMIQSVYNIFEVSSLFIIPHNPQQNEQDERLR